MTKQIVFFLLFLNYSMTGQAQPDPEQFLFNHIYVDVDSGAQASFLTLSAWNDSILYSKNNYFNQEENLVFSAPDRSLIVNNLNPNTTVFGIHYLNSKQENVYVYLFGTLEKNGIIDLNGKGEVALERMDLQRGTYFIDWSSRQNKEFHQRIQKHVKQNDQKYQASLDSLQVEIKNKRWCSKRKRAEFSFLEKEKIRYKHENDSNRFLGYYEVYYETTAQPNGPYKLDNFVFIVNEKAAQEQKISDYPISQEEVIEYINTGTCKNPELAQQILETLK